MALRHALTALLILLPLPALASDTFCNSLRRAVAEARDAFAAIGPEERVLPGAVEALRDVDPEAELNYDALLNIVIMRHGAEVPAAPIERRFRRLLREVPRCMPELRPAGEVRIPESSSNSWRLGRVEVTLQLDRPPVQDVFVLAIGIARLRS